MIDNLSSDKKIVVINSNKNKTSDDFIQFKTKEEVCNFFDSKGFEKNESDDYDTYDDMISDNMWEDTTRDDTIEILHSFTEEDWQKLFQELHLYFE